MAQKPLGAIVKYTRNDITTQLKVDFYRVTEEKIAAMWCHLNISEIENTTLQIYQSLIPYGSDYQETFENRK